MARMDSFVCIDLETTGLNPKSDKIIEIGALKVRNGFVEDRYETFVNPGRSLEEITISITGIQEKDLKKAPEIGTIIGDFIDFTEDLPLLGHSVLFDYSFIKKAAVNHNFSFERNGIDTLRIARAYLTQLPSKNLGQLCQFYNIDHNAHRAMGDVEATYKLYLKLLQEFEGKDENLLFQPKPLNYQVKKESPITRAQKERLYLLIERHKIETEYQIDKLTKNEASRYTDQILAKYGRY